MTTINEIFQTFGHEYIQRFGDNMPTDHLKVINAIKGCHTQEAGLSYYECQDCGHIHVLNRSCGNRHCPTCQNHKTRQWLEKQMQHQLPGHHFMITFTVPEALREYIRSHQRIGYSALFKASSDAIKKLTPDSKYMGGNLPGFFGVLHTWGRTLGYHPHIHYIVAGGAFCTKSHSWHPSRIDFYLPVKALSKIFKAKFKDEIKSAGLLDEIPYDVWECDWNVNCRAVGESSAAIKYLAPYVFKVAISNSRIVKVEQRRVTFKYKKSHSNRLRTMELDVMEFIRRFLQHVLPTGFMKVRYYGFMNQNCKIQLDTISALIELSYDFDVTSHEMTIETRESNVCPRCGGKLKLKAIVLPSGVIICPD